MSFSQVPDSLDVKTSEKKDLITDVKKMNLTSGYDFNGDFKNYQFNLKSFSVYNQTSGFNDVYLNNKENSYFFSKSVLLQGNEFRAYKKDSFNPMGLSTGTSNIFVGVIGVFLEKIQEK